MTKELFLDLTILQQIEYFNKLMAEGGSLSSICKELGISKSISSKFKGHGYVFLDKQYLLQEGNKTPPNKPQERAKEKKGIVTPIKTNIVGRPKKIDKNKVVKMTLEIDKSIHKALKYMAIDKEITITSYIEKLIKADLNEKYFKL